MYLFLGFANTALWIFANRKNIANLPLTLFIVSVYKTAQNRRVNADLLGDSSSRLTFPLILDEIQSSARRRLTARGSFLLE